MGGGGGGGKSGGKGGGGYSTRVARYYLSIHYGVCSGPIDAFIALYYNERLFWKGVVADPYTAACSNPGLFGGDTKEGGVEGTINFLPGKSNQVLPNDLAGRLGLTSSTCPGFRGLASLFFTGGSGGFYWSSNSPYIRSIWATVRRMPKGMGYSTSAIGDDANPAHIIYECLTDREWGMGSSSSNLDVESFKYAANVLIKEEFGLSMMWARQDTIENFVGEVLNHIDATLFVSPRTGLITLKLLRDDYDPAKLRVFGPDNCKLTKFQRKLWGETINEIVVTWTNPLNEKEETYTIQDLGNIACQGGEVISDSRNYYGIRNKTLAQKVAARALRSASSPLASAELEIDRTAWDLEPGQCFKLYWPEYGIEGLVMRITGIDYGTSGSMTVKVPCVEDVFGMPSAAYGPVPATQWVDTSETPRPMAYSRAVTLPAFYVRRMLGEANLKLFEYPATMAGVLATHDGADTSTYDLMTEDPLPNGDLVFMSAGRRPTLGRATLPTAFAPEAETFVEGFPDLFGGFGPSVGGFVWIGDVDDALAEIAMVKSSSTSGWTLLRGVLDTVPKNWPAGTPCWFAGSATPFADLNQRVAGVTQRYKLLTNTSIGQLTSPSAPVLAAKLSARPHLPLRPANVRVEGVAFSRVAIPSTATAIQVTWSNRNREFEDAQVLSWVAGTVPPEDDQTTTLEVIDDAGRVLKTYTGLAGTSFALPLKDFNTRSGNVAVALSSERDGLQSLQKVVAPISISPQPVVSIGGAPLTVAGNYVAMGTASPPYIVIGGYRIRIAGHRILGNVGLQAALTINGDHITVNHDRIVI